MSRYKKVIVLILVFPLLICACVNLSQPRNKIDFYTLEYDPPKISGLKPLPVVLRIERFSVAPIYNTNRIIYRDKSFKRNAYVYHKWGAGPGDLASCFLNRDLKESSLFKAVLSRDSRLPSSYMIEGLVEEFFELDMEDTWQAVLSLCITLMAEEEPDISKKILFQKTYSAKEVCNKQNPRALAEAMSRAMKKISGKIIKDIYHCLSPIHQ